MKTLIGYWPWIYAAILGSVALIFLIERLYVEIRFRIERRNHNKKLNRRIS